MRKALALLALCLSASLTQAADLPLKSRPYAAPPVVWSWTGAYLGLDAGYGWSNGDDTLTVDGVSASVSPKANGFIGGLYAGYNYQFAPSWVAGIETDISWADIKRTADVTGKTDLEVPFAFQAEDKLKWLGTTRARLGWLPTQNQTLMLYGTAGLAYGGLDSNVIASIGSSSINSEFAQNFSTTSTRVGWAAGAGAEYAVTPNLLARLEWLHYDLGKTDVSFEQSSRHDGDIVRAGLAWKFSP